MGSQNDFSVQALRLDNANKNQAEIIDSLVSQGFICRAITLDLSAGYGAPYGNAFKVNFPFRGVFIRGASDSQTNCSIALNSDNQINLDNGLQLFLNDQFDLGKTVAAGAVTAPAQPGKSITIWFLVQGKFQSGSQLSLTAGGVSLSTGTGMTAQNAITIGVGATQILAADDSRKKATLRNVSGGGLWLGGTNAVKTDAGGAGTTIGLFVGTGQVFEWTNTGAIFGISDTGCVVALQTES